MKKSKLSFTLSTMLFVTLLLATFLAGWTANEKINPQSKVDENVLQSYTDPVVVDTHSDRVKFSAKSFKKDIETYISQIEYGNAMRLLMLAPVDEILESNREDPWFCAADDTIPGSAVWESDVILPGVKKNYDASRDWVIPHSDWSSRSVLWAIYCRVFATRFNRRLMNKNKVPNTVKPESNNLRSDTLPSEKEKGQERKGAAAH